MVLCASQGYLQQMLPPGTLPHVLEEVGRTFTVFASSIEQDVPADSVVVEEVKSLGREAFLQVSERAQWVEGIWVGVTG